MSGVRKSRFLELSSPLKWKLSGSWHLWQRSHDKSTQVPVLILPGWLGEFGQVTDFETLVLYPDFREDGEKPGRAITKNLVDLQIQQWRQERLRPAGDAEMAQAEGISPALFCNTCPTYVVWEPPWRRRFSVSPDFCSSLNCLLLRLSEPLKESWNSSTFSICFL